MIPASLLQGIEFVKGPSSSMHGRGGVAGTVNFFTVPEGAQETGGEWSITVGSWDTYEAKLTAQVPRESGSLSVAGLVSSSDHYQDDTGRDQEFFTLSLRHLFSDRASMELQYLYSNRLNLGAVRTEENILWSFAPHDISIFQDLIGAEPVEVVSRGGAFLQPDVHDSTMTVLTYPDNVVGHIFVSWLHPFKEHRLVVIGSRGMLSFEDSSPERDILFYAKGFDWVEGVPVKRDGPTEVIHYERTMPLTEELRYFVEHLDGRPIEIADGDHAEEVLRILERASASLTDGGRVSHVPG